VDGVVGTDEKIGAYPGQLVGGGKHQLSDTLPIIAVNAFHVFGQRMRVHRNLGVIVGP
jgi:hypothetical protein